MNALITEAKLHGYKFGIATSYTHKKSFMGSSTLPRNDEPVNLLVVPVAAANILEGLEKELKWYRTDYCQWAKRKTKLSNFKLIKITALTWTFIATVDKKEFLRKKKTIKNYADFWYYAETGKFTEGSFVEELVCAYLYKNNAADLQDIIL